MFLVTEGFGQDVAHVVTQGFYVRVPVGATAKASLLTQAFGAASRYSPFLVTEGFGGAAVRPQEHYSGGYRERLGRIEPRRPYEPSGPYPVTYFERETAEQRDERIRRDRIRFGVIPDEDAIRAKAELEEHARQQRVAAAARAARELADKDVERVAAEARRQRPDEPIVIGPEELRLSPEEIEDIRRGYRDEYARRAIALILMAASST